MMLLLFLWLPLLDRGSSYFSDVYYLIDCGGANNFTNQFNQSWLSDRWYSGGDPGLVSEPHKFNQLQEKSLRFFPVSFGKRNCYSVKVPNGRYYIRMFSIYDNYDSKLHSPSYDISIEGTLVYSWRNPWPDDLSKNGAYSDAFAFVKDNDATICFYSIATDSPVIGSLEVVQIDPLSYDSSSTGSNVILVNYGRLTCGSDLFGSGFTNDTDIFGRVWQSDKEFRSKESKVRVLSTRKKILGGNQAPNFFPTYLYQTAISGSRSEPLEYLLPVDTRLDYMLWFHFVEINPSVYKAGQRIFDIYVNEKNVNRIDIFKQVGGFHTFNWRYMVNNLNSTPLSVKLVPIVGPPLISGLENYAVVPSDRLTVSSQANAMRSLKESLQIPDRMGWNGDPCAPSSWDAWEGVTCHHSEDGSSLMITHLDLGSQGLKGYISERIASLTNLVSLNLSFNSLVGNLPAGIGQRSLIRLDLSNNQLTGTIPESLGSPSLQLVLLNDNQLEGQVSEKLYSVAVHGGEIDLAGNKGLCGVPPLPACPFFWRKGRLSDGAKIAIAMSCVVIFFILSILSYVLYMRRKRNDYDFAPSQDLMSIAAKRNRYQRQKSRMLLEMETQNANGFRAPSSPLSTVSER